MSDDPMVPGRLPLVAADSDDPALAAVFDMFRDRGREPPVLYRTLANAPAMLQAWVDLAWPLRTEAATSRGLRELMIMRVAQLTGAHVEWLAHWPLAVHSGITEEQLAALSSWPTSDLFSDDERAALAMTDELTTDLDLRDDTFASVSERFDAGAIVELMLTVSFYNCVSRVLRGLGLRAGDDDDPRLAYFREA